MKKIKWYRFVFSDGYVCICAGMNKMELASAERKHGNLISKSFDGMA